MQSNSITWKTQTSTIIIMTRNYLEVFFLLISIKKSELNNCASLDDLFFFIFLFFNFVVKNSHDINEKE